MSVHTNGWGGGRLRYVCVQMSEVGGGCGMSVRTNG